jgi:hypothetical protein
MVSLFITSRVIVLAQEPESRYGPNSTEQPARQSTAVSLSARRGTHGEAGADLKDTSIGAGLILVCCLEVRGEGKRGGGHGGEMRRLKGI